MTPLKTLRTAQLFQMSWPRISSTVGNLIGSIGGFSGSFEMEEPLGDSDSVLLEEAIAVAQVTVKCDSLSFLLRERGFRLSPPVEVSLLYIV